MAVQRPRSGNRVSAALFLLGSLALHAAVLFAIGWSTAPSLELSVRLPDEVELGLLDGEPGEEGSPPPAAPPAVEPPPAKPLPPEKPEPEVSQHSEGIVLADAAVEPPDAGAPPLVATPTPSVEAEPRVPSSDAGLDGLAASSASGDGVALFGQGTGLGFGAGGFGSGLGGPPGAVIGLHLQLDRIRDSSLILEIQPLLEIIPQWRQLLGGSGFDALRDFSRLFVATPNRRRSHLVVSARARGGRAAVERAVKKLAAARGQPIAWSEQGGLPTARWFNRGPTARAVALLPGDQFVIARPEDVGRALAVSAAIALRHAQQPGMERLPGAASLLAMYEGEAVALSVEGARRFVDGRREDVPRALRFSLTPVDEFHARLRAFGYYASAEQAQQAMSAIEELRSSLLDHPQVTYLGLRSALAESKLARDAATLELDVDITLHQTRYLMGFVSSALAPR